MQIRYSSSCWFTSLQQQLPSSGQQLNLGSVHMKVSDGRQMLALWGTQRRLRQSGPQSSLLTGGCWVFSTLSSFLLHSTKLDSSQTRVKLGYTAVAEFPKCHFFGTKFLPLVRPDLSLSLKGIFSKTLNQIQKWVHTLFVYACCILLSTCKATTSLAFVEYYSLHLKWFFFPDL